ncbi:MAG: autotransporter domain-containing protein, partial [Gammaproteobacteria bacterium]
GAVNATYGSDYTVDLPTVSIAIDTFTTTATQSVTINAIDDIFAEPDEAIGLQLVNPRADNACTAALGNITTATYTLMDDPTSQSTQTVDLIPPVNNTIIEDQNGDGAQVDLQVTLNNPGLGGPCTIEADISQVASDGNDATLNEDYTLSGNTVTFNIPDTLPSTVSQTISVGIVDDQTVEAAENLTLQLSNFRVAPGTNVGETQCSVAAGDNIVASMTIEDGLTSNREAIALSGAPGTTVTDSFTVTGSWDDITVSAENSLATVNAARLDTPTRAWQVTYSFTLPNNESVGRTLQDLITITGIVQARIVPLANPTAVPVTIDVIAGEPTPKPTPTGTAWQQLCAGAQDPELVQRCELTVVGAGIYALNTQQENDVLPEEYAAMGTGSIDLTQNQLKTVFYQQQARRQGLKGLNLNRLTMTLDGQLLPFGQLVNSYMDKASGGNAGDPQRGPWSIFVSGRVNTGKKGGTVNDAGYDFDTNGLTAGADYLINNQSFVGGALGYAAMDSTFGNNGGDMDIKATTLTVYSSYFRPNNVYLDGSLTYGPNNYKFTRNIASFSTQTTGDADGNQFAISLAGGWDYYQKSFNASPYLRIDYIDISIDAYQEQGGSGLALNIEKQDVTSVTTALGGRFSYAGSMSWGVLMPSAHLEWIHEYKDEHRNIVASFVANPGTSFSTPVDEVDKDYLNLGLGITANFPEGRVLFLQYETAAEQKNFTTHTVHLGARMDL